MLNIRSESKGHKQDQRSTLAVGAIGLILIVAFFQVVPWVAELETSMHPVTTKAVVFNVREVSGGVIVSAMADKLRDCDWERTEFRFGEREGRSVPMYQAAHRGPPQLNVKGDSMFWPDIFLPVSPEMVIDTHWNAYHLCYPVRAWLTKTKFYN